MSDLLKRLSFWGPPIFFLICMQAPLPLISAHSWQVLGLMQWMLVWWLTEVVPLGMTSLLPLTVLPLLQIPGLELKQVAQPYGSEIVFLFFGGFVLAIALEKWGLHRRIALNILKKTGTQANHIVLGFLMSAAFLSMWISNTATAVMMLPIATSVLRLLKENQEDADSKEMQNFAVSIMLAIAYGANLGGTMTIIGTPPNLVLVGFLKDRGIDLRFFDWLKIGIPFGLLSITFSYFLLVKWIAPNHLGHLKGAKEMIDHEIESIGKISRIEMKVLAVFGITAIAWIFGAYLRDISFLKGLSDTNIALIAAFSLFLIKADDQMILVWEDMKRIPWDIFFLFGGGLTLAFALEKVGLIHAIGQSLGHLGSDSWIAIFILTFISLSLTEVMSNVALVTVFLPVVDAVAKGNGISSELLCIPVTMAASCAFMLPMGTPPNAIVFASGHVSMAQMCRAGFFLNLFCVIVITILSKLVL